MNRTGHFGLNALLFVPVASYLAAEDRIILLGIGIGVVVWGASLPDVDQWLPIAHRGPTHTVWFAALVGGTISGGLWHLGIPSQDVETALWGLGFGMFTVLGHLLGDVLTPSGVKPIAPVSNTWVSLRLVRANNLLANWGLFLVGSCLLVGSLTVGAGEASEVFVRLLGGL